MAEKPFPRVYPLTAPADDARFTFGLINDVAEVLAAHGYPPITSGLDFIHLRQVLFGFLYQPAPSAMDTVTNEEC